MAKEEREGMTGRERENTESGGEDGKQRKKEEKENEVKAETCCCGFKYLPQGTKRV